MDAIIAFEDETQTYILPLHGQPKYVSKIEAGKLGLKKVALPELAELQEKCNKPSILLDYSARQKIYLWWMGLNEESRAAIIG